MSNLVLLYLGEFPVVEYRFFEATTLNEPVCQTMVKNSAASRRGSNFEIGTVWRGCFVTRKVAIVWALQGSNLRPADYESAALTN